MKKVEAEKRRDRIKKKRIMEERWELIRWITEYIDRNKEKWEREKLERDQEGEQGWRSGTNLRDLERLL